MGGRDREEVPFADETPDISGGPHQRGWGWERAATPSSTFRGRGPKNYRRDATRIHDDVCVRLTADGAVDATDVEVSVDEGVVFLRGTVADRAQKRRAEALAERVRGVEDVVNELRIARDRSASAVASENRVPSNNSGRRRS